MCCSLSPPVCVQEFRQDGGEVQTQWVAYTDKMDAMLQEAFRLNIKWSLQELSMAINGDGKTSPNPLFRVKVVLTDKVCIYPQAIYINSQ